MVSRGFKGVYGVSRGFKGVIYEFRSCIGICMFLKSILTKQYGNNTKNRFKVVSRGFTGVSRWFQGGLRELFKNPTQV